MEIDGLHPTDPHARERGSVAGFDGRRHVRPALPEVEQGLLAAALLEETAALRVTDLLTPDAFDSLHNRQVFEALIECIAKGVSPDLLGVASVLRQRDESAAVARAMDLTGRMGHTVYVSGSDVDRYCLILIEQQVKRRQFDLANWIQTQALDPTSDALGVQDELEQQAFDIMPDIGRPHIVTAGRVTGKVFDAFREAAEGQTGLLGASTGFAKLDKATRGYRPGKHYVALAAPGMGKTVFGIGGLRSTAVQQNIPTAYFCVEMEADELAERLIISDAGVSADAAAEGRLIGHDWKLLEAARARIDAAPITFDCTPGLTIDHIETQLRRLVRFGGVQVAFIDYLQRIDYGDHANTYERGISYVSGRLKHLARELGIAIITLSQITREKAKEGKEPGKHDARGSGDVENDADVIVTIYRPEEVGIEFDETHNMITAGLCIIGLPKVRGGKKFIGNERLICTFEGDHVRIVDQHPDLSRRAGHQTVFDDDDVPF